MDNPFFCIIANRFFHLQEYIFMDEDIKKIFKQKINVPKFKRTIGLFGATTLGVGALMGAGIYVLIGEAAKVSGPSVFLSYLITGILAYFTTLMYAELARIIPRSGGGYTYAYNILGSIGGFTTGWFLAIGSIFASGLYAMGFAEYALSLLGKPVHLYIIRMVAVIITLGLGFLYVFVPVKKKSPAQNWIVWGNVAILLILIVFAAFNINPDNAKPFLPKGLGGTFSAISIIYISFFGYQLIANNADEVINPEKTIPKAMKLSMWISITIYLLIAMTSVLMVPWEKLAESSAPLVLVANEVFGGKGWIIISLGGILASLGALSSTIVSQSRQTYAMGKDRFFPDILGKLNEKSKQPSWALLTGVILVTLSLIFFDVQFIAKAANFCLLFSLLPVSLALRKIYKKNPALKPKARWKHFLPAITFFINIGLLLTLDIVSLAFGQQLAIIGVIVYFLYSRKREQRGKEGVNIILEKERSFSFFTRNRVLIPVSNPNTQKALLMLSHTLLAKKGGEIVVLAIKNVPEKMDFYEALAGADETLEVIKRSIEIAKKQNIKIKPVIRASRTISQGIVNVANEENSDLIIMGFPKLRNDGEPSVTDDVLRTTSTDTIILNLKTQSEDFKIRRIGVYVQSYSSLNLMIMTATALAEKSKATIVLFSFLPPGYGKKQKANKDKLIIKSLQNLQSTALYEISLTASDNPRQEILNMSSEFDLLLLEEKAHQKSFKSHEESFAFQVADEAKCSVIIVKSVIPLKKFVQRL